MIFSKSTGAAGALLSFARLTFYKKLGFPDRTLSLALEPLDEILAEIPFELTDSDIILLTLSAGDGSF